MKRMCKRLFALLLLGLCTGSLVAQQELSLAQLVEQALQENYQIRIAQNAITQAENSDTYGNAGYFPTVNLNGERRTSVRNARQEFFSGDSQQATNARSTATSATLEVNWVVFDGLAVFARKDRLEQLTALSKADLRFFVEQTVADLALAYYQLQQQDQLLARLRESLDVSQVRLAFEEQALEIGTSNRLNVQLAQVDRNTDSSLIIQQEALLLETTIAINRLINRDLGTSLVPTDSLVLREDLVLEELITAARNNNAALQQRRLAELLAETNAEITNGALFPEVSLFGNYDFNRQSNEVGFLQSSRTFGPEYGIRVRFNLFSGQQVRIAQQNAQIDIATEQLRTADLNLEIEQSIRTAYLRWETALRQANLERESVAAAEAALTVARRQYELGELTNIDFRVIQLNLVNAQTRLLEAQFTAKQREVELLRWSGSLLEVF